MHGLAQDIIAGLALLCALMALLGPFIWPNLGSGEMAKKESPPLNRSFLNGHKLTTDEHRLFADGKCPDCGAEGLLEGPHGGMSINVYCPNESGCGSRFNFMGPFGVDRITDASPAKRSFVEQQTPYRN